MKNDRNIFRLQCEPRSCDSREDHHTRLIEYDDRMRQEEKKYSRLLMELNNSRWSTQSDLYKGSKQSDFEKYAVDQTMDEGQSSELEVTRLTGDEILYGGGLTMDQVLLRHKKPSALEVDTCLETTISTKQLLAFHYNLSPQERNDARSAKIEMNQAASRDTLESNGRESFPWESVMVESVGLGLQRWRGVCSFSLSSLCSWNKDDIDATYHLSSEKQSRTGE